MSADLLAEFDTFYTPPTDKKTSTVPASNDLAFLSNPGQSGTSRYGVRSHQWQAHAQESEGEIWGGMSSLRTSTTAAHTHVPKVDIWGSFEASLPLASQAPAHANAAIKKHEASRGSEAIPAPRKGHTRARSSTIDLFANNMQDLPSPTKDTRLAKTDSKPNLDRQPSHGAEVLFDADEVSAQANDDDDDDDFGEFETVTAPEPPPSHPPPSSSLEQMFGATSLNSNKSTMPIDLLGLSTGSLPYPQASKSPNFQERNPFNNLAHTVAPKQISSHKNDSVPALVSTATAWPDLVPRKPDPHLDSPAPPSNPLDDEWGEFADLPAEPSASKTSKPTTDIEADAWVWDNADGLITPAVTSTNEAPPSNIPPPSVLLALFPSLFDLPQSSLFKAVANQPFSLRNRIISDRSTIEFLRAYLLIATVAARIIAGRKLRWKRDTLLSQAMKIGPAAARGKGGMKLTGVDKSEAIREDREAADVARVWKDQLGRLKSAVAVANTSLQDVSKHLVIPEIAEAMQVKTQEGGLTAPKQCLVCGLKREERVAKVDVRVEDSFGEWWAEHWGHRACKNFWQEHEAKLQSR